MTEERITKAQRWLDLIACLLARRTPATTAEIFRAVPAYRTDAADDAPEPESVRRMFERDKKELRELGIPIETRTFGSALDPSEGYVLRRDDLHLPYLRVVEAADAEGTGPDADAPMFAREDLHLVFEALREVAEIPGWPLGDEARSAFRKLSFDLGTPPGEPAVRHVGQPGGPELTRSLRQLMDAFRLRRRVKFRYHGLARGAPTDRDVAPFGLFLERGAWYLVGQDALRDEVRMFHVGRMEKLRPAGGEGAYDVPDEFSLADYRNRRAWEYGDEALEIEARVHFDHPLSLWAERNGYGELERRGESGDAVRTFGVRHVGPFLCLVLGFAGSARVVDPPELVDELRDMALLVGERHA